MENNSNESAEVSKPTRAFTTTLNMWKEKVLEIEYVKCFIFKMEEAKPELKKGMDQLISNIEDIWSMVKESPILFKEKLMSIPYVSDAFNYVYSSSEGVLYAPSLSWKDLFQLYKKEFWQGVVELHKLNSESLRRIIESYEIDAKADSQSKSDDDDLLSSDDESEMSHHDLLGNLTDYNSSDDPDFRFDSEDESNVSVDSLEYRSTENEEAEEPFSKEELEKVKKALEL